MAAPLTFDIFNFEARVHRFIDSVAPDPLTEVLANAIFGISSSPVAGEAVGRFLAASNIDESAREFMDSVCILAVNLPFAIRTLAQIVAHVVHGWPQCTIHFSQSVFTFSDIIEVDVIRHKKQEDLTRHINIHTLRAALIELGLYGPPFDVTHTRIIGLDDPLQRFARDIEVEGVQEHGYIIAAQYLIHASPTIASACGLEHGMAQGYAWPDEEWGVRGPLWRASPGYSLQRWEFWLNQLRAITTNEDLLLTTRKVAMMAVSAMELATRFPPL